MPQCRTQKRFSQVTCLRAAGHDGDHEFPTVTYVDEKPKAKRRRVNTQEFRMAQMISAILEERDDDWNQPTPVRLEQARKLLTNWSSAQGSLTGAFLEILNLKAGYCVRCPDGWPCEVCGRTDDDGPNGVFRF